ncbi:MAG: RNase adapter RapZ [Deltaproteobacteria bacterium]|nr:RNase adapter RapZ [Deltaproteobacteria bacterium]MBM4322537.1 RNase adapter RapZ [Deltaproteobacteria bacterium]MBM4346558.1 RNase adapter RapZ [Deltaproteobacteria bacterium]
MKNLRIILISGLSGSGKTTAVKALEDIGFYCVDNLPILLLPKFLELCGQSGGKISRVAVVEDIREADSRPASGQEEADFFEVSRRIIEGLRKEGYPIEIIFLDSSDPVLMRRFSETRRQHPLALGGSILEGIRMERERLEGIRDMANQVIDTSQYNVHELKEKIQQYAQEGSGGGHLTITLLSFGYSFGVPYEADLLFDVRFLPNPYFVEELKHLKGDHPSVAEYLLQWEETKEFLNRTQDFIGFLLPFYLRERRTHLTIAVGCTGGRHRSIVIVNQLVEMLRDKMAKQGVFLSVRHRDAERG